MTDDPNRSQGGFAGPALFYALLWLFFFQLCSDFIETIYAIGLMGVEVPPELVSALLFFTPALLFISKRRLPAAFNLALMGGVALLRLLDLFVYGGAKMIVSGLGVGAFLLLLPAWLARRAAERDVEAADEFSAGLPLALAFSILLRTLATTANNNAGWLNWIPPLYFLVMLSFPLRQALKNRRDSAVNIETSTPHGGFGAVAAACVGMMSVLALLYFALVSPTVAARWTEADYRLVLLFLGAGLALYAALLRGAPAWIERVSNTALLLWNALFMLCGLVAILFSGLRFPASSAAYPLDQPPASLAAQVALYAMLLLSPALLLTFTRLARSVVLRGASPRALAGGFSLGALFFLVIVLAQAFTTVYDYIPVIGPFWRDRFWLVFLLAGLGAALPLLALLRYHPSSHPLPSPYNPSQNPRNPWQNPLYGAAFPLLVGALLLSVVWAVWQNPRPAQPPPTARLRVLTYNIQQGYDINTRNAFQTQLEAIRNFDADVIGLQESDTARFSGGNADLVRTLAEGLNLHAYYGPRTVTGTFGIALLSRYPLENPRTFYMFSEGEQTAAILAEITVEGVRYHILVTHLGNGGPIIQQQQVLERLNGLDNVIAMGDFNFRPSTEQYALTVQSMQDAWVLGGETPTEGLDPQHRIDHVFVSPDVAVHSATYYDLPVSDHPALLVEITP